jgi:hypothetical protein
MWRDGRDAGSGLCTRTRIRTGRTEAFAHPLPLVLRTAPRRETAITLKHLQPTVSRNHDSPAPPFMLPRLPRPQAATRHKFGTQRHKIGQIAKSRRCSSEPHNLSAAWAEWRPWHVLNRAFVMHGRSGP